MVIPVHETISCIEMATKVQQTHFTLNETRVTLFICILCPLTAVVLKGQLSMFEGSPLIPDYESGDRVGPETKENTAEGGKRTRKELE